MEVILLDIRDFLFSPLEGKSYLFEIKARESGVLAGARRLKEEALRIGLFINWVGEDGMILGEEEKVFQAIGDAWQIALSEERLLGLISKVSGVATASARMVSLAKGRIRVVCGAWKKVPVEIRGELREAIKVGGAGIRILEEPFVYLDKNYIRMFGGLAPAVRRAKEIEGRVVVVQIRGESSSLEGETMEALREGADLLMVDTGRLEDFIRVRGIVIREGFQGRVKLAFSGGVKEKDLERLIDAGVDIVDVGRAIIDAPLLDFSLDVVRCL